jgi:hypothetical protein
MANIKTITEADAINFPVVADFVGQAITSTEWYKAISGEKFKVGVEKDAEEVDESEVSNTEVADAPVKKVAKKSK